MPAEPWVRDDNAALFTDLYQLTMLQAYYVEGMDDEAIFDLFIRRLRTRNFLVACGLEDVLRYLETLRFTPESLDYLASLGRFRDDFLAYLADFRFTGDVYAVPEGTVVFAEEPIIEVVAPIGQGQLIETFLLNQITFQTGIASKAVRVARAAAGRTVMDFGMRRMHGTDAAMKAARACAVAGIGATSNVLAAEAFGLEPSGTMAHSYIEAHDDEDDAFVAFVSLYPGTTLLVDTYDTLEAVDRLIALWHRHESFRPGAIRLDSGDLAALAREARARFDAAGLNSVRILASGSLDEFSLRELVASGAPIDGFGVGTRLGTLADQPYLDSAYKLSGYAGRGRMKLAESKSNLPCRKQVYRQYGPDGRATGDVIARINEEPGGEPLLVCVMRGGERTDAGRASLDDARQRAQASVAALPERLLALEAADPPYPVAVSERLRATTDRIRQELENQD